MDIIEKSTTSNKLLDSLSKFNQEAYSPVVQRAKEGVKGMEFPTSKTEYWKYSRTGKITNKSWNVGNASADIEIGKYIPEGFSGKKYVFVNGVFRSEYSSDFGGSDIFVSTVKEASQQNPEVFNNYFGAVADIENHIFSAINTAYQHDGLFVHIPKNTFVSESVFVLHISTGEEVMAQPRNLIIAEQGAEAKMILAFANEHESFTNGLTEIFVGENANLSIDKVQTGSEKSFQILTEECRQHSNSRYTLNTLSLNGNWIRNNSNSALNGENIEAHLNGLYFPNGSEHVDNHTIMDHTHPHCESNELYKGILSDKSTGVFNGKVYVRQDAQKTNAFQSNANILQSDDATINSKPELEIYADDVKCSHGSTIGQLDTEALFYLRARGLSEKSARNLLVRAFSDDVLEKIIHQEVREMVEQAMEKKFKWSV